MEKNTQRVKTTVAQTDNHTHTTDFFRYCLSHLCEMYRYRMFSGIVKTGCLYKYLAVGIIKS